MKDFISTITLFGIKGGCPIFLNFDLISNIIFSATLGNMNQILLGGPFHLLLDL